MVLLADTDLVLLLGRYELWKCVGIYLRSRVMGVGLNRNIPVTFFDRDIFSHDRISRK